MIARIAALAFPIAAALCLAGCSGRPQERPQPIVTTVEVAVPVAQPCVPATLGPAPDYPDTDEALKQAADAAQRYLLLVAGRILRAARLKELEIVAAGCPRATAP